jgi:AraC family L-rhamnose operon regulatory protein RhaS
MELVTTSKWKPVQSVPIWHNPHEVFAPEFNTGTRFRLVLVERGTGILCFSERRKPFIAPALFCLNEKEHPVLEQSLNLQAQALYFHPHLANYNFTFEHIRRDAKELPPMQRRDLSWLGPFLRRDATYEGYLSVGPATHLRLSSLLNAIGQQIVQQEDTYWSCRSVSFLLELLLLLSRLLYPSGTEQDVPSISLRDPDGEVDPVVLYLHTHYQQKVTIAELAKRFHTNRTTLSERFREVTGMTIMTYLIQLRIKLAAAMLRDTGLPVCEIHQRVGFNDGSHFRRTFRKYTGASPGEYRQRYHSGWWLPPSAG